uniref:site-specific DNA-methyltransferase (cytosine-N(4)-specific) n=1 Tax=Pithovirus LCDPAC02 TaxID=2506601 RepID=A0A481YQK2_9VIRU|nr:MAG: type I restriction-modification system methyltransferase [Pithovirus LCDPAC02]
MKDEKIKYVKKKSKTIKEKFKEKFKEGKILPVTVQDLDITEDDIWENLINFDYSELIKLEDKTTGSENYLYKNENQYIKYYPLYLKDYSQYYNYISFTEHFGNLDKLMLKVIRKKKGQKDISPYDGWFTEKTLNYILNNFTSKDLNNILNKNMSEELKIKMIDLHFNKNIYGSHYVSHFDPMIIPAIFTFLKSENIITKEFNKLKVLDPSSGWGDRMTSCAILGIKKYYGFDPNWDLIESYYQLKKFLREKTKIKFENATEFITADLPYEESNFKDDIFDIVITSPPFFNLEVYKNDKTQSYIKYNKYGTWFNKWFKNFIIISIRFVKLNGLFIVHVNNVRDMKIHNDMIKYIKELQNVEILFTILYERGKNLDPIPITVMKKVGKKKLILEHTAKKFVPKQQRLKEEEQQRLIEEEELEE